MSRPLPHGDPAHLGPFQLTARLSETPAGITFLGVDGQGRQVSVAVLTRGAAGDAAARDRFRAAILGAEPGGTAPVVAAEPEGPTPWVAAAYEPHARGAERFLDSVLLTGTFRGDQGGRSVGRLRGPQFQPYWMGSGSREPAIAAPSSYGPADDADRPVERGLVAAILMLVALLAVLLLLLSMLFACQPEPPPPSPTFFPSPTFEAPTPTSPSPSPTQTGSGSPTPDPSGSDGSDPGGSA